MQWERKDLRKVGKSWLLVESEEKPGFQGSSVRKKNNQKKKLKKAGKRNRRSNLYKVKMRGVEDTSG